MKYRNLFELNIQRKTINFDIIYEDRIFLIKFHEMFSKYPLYRLSSFFNFDYALTTQKEANIILKFTNIKIFKMV